MAKEKNIKIRISEEIKQEFEEAIKTNAPYTNSSGLLREWISNYIKTGSPENRIQQVITQQRLFELEKQVKLLSVELEQLPRDLKKADEIMKQYHEKDQNA